MKDVKAELISVGTELLLGQIADTNAQWLSEQFALHGIDTYFHTVVGDNLLRVKKVFIQAHERSNVIVVTGGLGPTEDDLTREAFQKFSQLEMTYDEQSLNKIKSYYVKQHVTMTPNNKRQARVFKNAQIIPNETGMAPGMIVPFENRIWVFLPGVPYEMKQMVLQTVLPYLKKQLKNTSVIRSMIVKCVGIGESRLEHELYELIHHQDNPTIAPLTGSDGISLRVTVKETSVERANHLLEQTKEKIMEKIGPYVIGTNNETLMEKVKQLLQVHDQSIAAAESITGGLFTDQLIAVEGASQVCRGGIVCYDTRSKRDVLNVSPNTIARHGVVSEACVKEMADKVRSLMDSDFGIAFSGVAGPATLEGHPVGTVYIAIHHDKGEMVETFLLQGDRQTIRKKAANKGFEMLFTFLKNNFSNE